MSKVILVVDDDARLAQALITRLDAVGYDPLHAATGAHAIAAVQQGVPSAVILDIRLPDMDGFAVCKTLRAMPGFRDIPIIFLSANSSQNDRKRAKDSGGSEFFSKPCKPAELLETLARLCAEGTTPAVEGIQSSGPSPIAAFQGDSHAD